MYRLQVIKIKHKNGSCFFHAVSHQLKLLDNSNYIPTFNHGELRYRVLEFMKANEGSFNVSFTTEEEIDDYLDHVHASNAWEDNPIIWALINMLKINITIFDDRRINCDRRINNAVQMFMYNLNPNTSNINIGYIDKSHYVSLDEQDNYSLDRSYESGDDIFDGMFVLIDEDCNYND